MVDALNNASWYKEISFGHANEKKLLKGLCPQNRRIFHRCREIAD